MILAFIAFGVLVGFCAASFAFVSSGSILLAIAAYSIVGTLGALVAICGFLLVSRSEEAIDDWVEDKTSRDPVSA